MKAMKTDYIRRILSAPVYDAAVETPIDNAPFLSERLGNRILIKREDLQPVHSFKIRGAYNKMVQLTANERNRGVIAASAGNHAQGVALAAGKLGIDATIVMPVTTPGIKVESVKKLGGRVILHGDTFNEAYNKAAELMAEKDLTFIHPYDDPDVIAGQGTVAMEILSRSAESPDAVFVPVGGGGLLAGMSVYIKFLNPRIKVFGVEAEDSACLKAALDVGERVKLDEVGIFADGVAVNMIGEETFRVIRENIDGVITVTTDEICAAIKDIYDDTRSITEPAGALAVAGLKKYVDENSVENKTLLAVNSGANINFDRLRHISERTEIGEKREAIFAVEIPEEPGSFKRFCTALKKRNITEFNYRYADKRKALVFVGIQLENPREGRKLIRETLEEQNYVVDDLSDDEIAKIHIRHMVGGRAPEVENEKLFSFAFPERPGALMNFLNGLGQNWNISLFHYRNHGAAYGRVLAGLQVDDSEMKDVRNYLSRLGYGYREISDNRAYSLFLK
ncbi:threonine ammonia-lyase, biosynthetic [Spirochaeta isovalerica]|uniref:L-threonine dehydratase n=1 Tax=Spirochaeta isovalerica TaxID=150 RepID=A0A841RHJ7_9SPIO|nr:threonine ammonia-lyase, biosynthetic [Spirochaeta isovalerica]MBB6482008.1 threonine dehydratase [Spirochaeta isovalerica]